MANLGDIIDTTFYLDPSQDAESEALAELSNKITFQNRLDKIARIVDKREKKMKQLVTKAMLAVFERNPRLITIGWRQEHVFNGSTMEFEIQDIELTFDGMEYGSYYVPPDASAEVRVAFQCALRDTEKARNLFSESFLRMALGEHVAFKIAVERQKSTGG